MNYTTEDIFSLRKVKEEFKYVLWEDEKFTPEQLRELKIKIKLIIYARVSTDEQEDNTSLHSQVQESFQKAEERFGEKFAKDEVIIIMESASGKFKSRKGIQYAIELMRQRMALFYIALHPDRTSRDSGHQQEFHKLFRSLGIKINYADVALEDTAEGHLVEKTLGALSEYQRERISILTERGRYRKISEKEEHVSVGFVYGYYYDKIIDKYVIDEVEAKVIHIILDLLMEKNLSRGQIEKELAKNKIPAPQGEFWHNKTITGILTNETFYTGIKYYGKTKVAYDENEKRIQEVQPREDWEEMIFPIIITKYNIEDVKRKMNIIKKEKNGRKTETRWVSKFVYCGRCGRKASHPIYSGTKDKKKYYYACQGKNTNKHSSKTGERKEQTCFGKNWRADFVDLIVWNSLKKHLPKAEFLIKEIVKEVKDDTNVTKLKKELDQYTKEKLKLTKANENMLADFYGGDSLITSKTELAIIKKANDDRIFDLNLKIEAIQSDLKLVDNNDIEVELLAKYTQKWTGIFLQENIDVQTKKMIMKAFIEKVTLNEDDSVVITYRFMVDNKTYDETIERIALFKNNEGEIKSECQHRKTNASETNSKTFYVEVIEYLSKAYNNNMKELYKFAEYLNQQEEIVKMYKEDLMTFHEIGEALNIGYWLIQDMIEYLEIPKYSLAERAKLKRAKDFDLIYDLHFNKKMSLNEIYREYKFSPIYCKSVLSDKGVKHQGYKNQLDLAESKKNLAPSPIDEKIQIKIAKRYAKGESPNILAKEYGITRNTVTDYAKKHGFYDLKEEKRKKLEQNIIKDYLEKEMGIQALAKKYDYKSNTAIQKILEKHNVKTRPSPQQYIQMLRNGEINTPVYRKFYKMKQANMKLHIEKISDEDLFELVITEKVSSSEIGWLFGCGRTTVYNRREKCGLIHNQNKTKLDNLKRKQN